MLPANRRTSREDMASAASDFMAAISNNGPAPRAAADDCEWLVNGMAVGDCKSPFGGPVLTRTHALHEATDLLGLGPKPAAQHTAANAARHKG